VPTTIPVAVSVSGASGGAAPTCIGRDAEIHQQRMLARQQDIGRLHIAVHDAMGVSVLERVGHLPGDP
jgi:hypothetical protein